MRRLKDGDVDLVILDICLPGMNGLDALAQIRQIQPTLPVIVMTGQGTTDTAIEATKRGAFDYQLKPFEPAEMLQTIAKALEAARLMKGRLALNPETSLPPSDAIVGRSPAMQQLYKAIGRVAPTDATVLIRGESGTGKELVARAIYQHSQRSQDAAGGRELRGHPRDALGKRTVRLRARRVHRRHDAADREVRAGPWRDDVSRRNRRHPADDPGQDPAGPARRHLPAAGRQRHAPIRRPRALCAPTATWNRRSPREAFARISTTASTWSPCSFHRCGRGATTFPLLVDYFLNRYARAAGIERPPLAQNALEALVNHSWPGNVRELEHLIQRLMIFAGGYTIQAHDLPWSLRIDAQAPAERSPPVPATSSGSA